MRSPRSRLRGSGLDRVADLSASLSQSAGQRFAASIDSIYRQAVAADPSILNRIAYGCYLARHRRPIDSLRVFAAILNDEAICREPRLLTEIAQRLIRIETDFDGVVPLQIRFYIGDDLRMPLPPERCGDEQDRTEFEFANQFAARFAQRLEESARAAVEELDVILNRLDGEPIGEITELVDVLWRDHATSRLRKTGLSLLSVALFCGKQNLCAIGVRCIRKALDYFEAAAGGINGSRLPVASQRGIAVDF